MTFGERLHQLRERAGMTQEQLAERSGVNLWTIRGYEQGRREPNWKGAISLAVALGIGVEAGFADCEEADGSAPSVAKPGRPRKTPVEAATTGENAKSKPKSSRKGKKK
jgi:transcriptional regulator with XRE-family HTH domain